MDTFLKAVKAGRIAPGENLPLYELLHMRNADVCSRWWLVYLTLQEVNPVGKVRCEPLQCVASLPMYPWYRINPLDCGLLCDNNNMRLLSIYLFRFWFRDFLIPVNRAFHLVVNVIIPITTS